jgi:hypothetical protein
VMSGQEQTIMFPSVEVARVASEVAFYHAICGARRSRGAGLS